MAKISVVVSRDPASLLERAAEPFLHSSERTVAEAFSSPGCLLALRQGALRDDLYRLAAGRGVRGWLDPAICIFQELPAWLGSTTRAPLGAFERAALIAHVLREHGGSLFRGRERAFLASVESLFGEFVAESVAAADFRAAAARCGVREEFETTRDDVLIAAYGRYLVELDRLNKRDGHDSLADAADAIDADAAGLAERLRGRREIRVFGLADLRGGWRRLLAALDRSPAVDRVIVYATDDPALPAELGASVERLETIGRATVVTVIAAVDADDEMGQVAIRARTLVENGTAPDRIAVVSREARPYGEAALRALERHGLPATTRRRVRYREIPVARAIVSLLKAAADGWTRHELAELGSQPFFASDVDARVINFIGYRRRVMDLDGWLDALERLVAEARVAENFPEGEDGCRPRTLPSAWVAEARDRFERFAAVAREIQGSRPLLAWLKWLAAWLRSDPWRIEERLHRVPEDRWQVVRLDLLGWEGMHGILDDWIAAEQQWPGDPAPLSVTQFVDRLEPVLDGDVALWTPEQRGVQVVEALAASHRAFDHVFLVGMGAGHFPRRTPSSLLLSEYDREALRAGGLPLEMAAEWDAREESLFRTLAASAAHSLTLSYVRLDELGGEASPSAFVDGLPDAAAVTRTEEAGVRPCRTRDVAAHAHRVAVIERLRATGRPSPWNGLIEAPDQVAWLAQEFGDGRVWSPTGIEAWAKCPWSFFSQRLLHLEALEDPDEDMDPRIRGAVLHDALRRFYDRARERVGGAVFLREADAAWAMRLLREALDEALAGAGQREWLGHPALRSIKAAELGRMLDHYLTFEISENEKSFKGNTTAGKTVRTAVERHEFEFANVELRRGGIRFLFRGIVDRVEIGMDERAPGEWVAAVDYKTTTYSTPGAGATAAWDDGVVLQVPLYAHALSELRPGTRVARVEYRAIKQAKRDHSLSLVKLSKKGGLEEDSGAQAKMERALDAVSEHVIAVRGGQFPARPAPSCHCPPFCHAWDICRVAGGPSTGRDE